MERATRAICNSPQPSHSSNGEVKANGKLKEMRKVWLFENIRFLFLF